MNASLFPTASPRLPLLARLDSVLLALLCFAMCGQIDLKSFGRDTLKEGLGYASKTFALSLSDVLFAVLVVWFLARTAQLRAWKRLWWPPLPCFALLFALVLSLVHSPAIGASIGADPHHHLFTKEVKVAFADIAQWVGYFGVAPWVLVNLLRDRRDASLHLIRRDGLALGALVAAFAVSGVVALVQQQVTRTAPPHGLWTSPNLFAGFTAFLLPLLLEIEIGPNRNPTFGPLNATSKAAPRLKARKPSTALNSETSIGRFEFLPLALTLFALGIVWLCVASPWAAAAGVLGLFLAWIARPNPKKLRITRLALLVFVVALFGLTWNRSPQLRDFRADELQVGSLSQKVKKRWIEWQVATRWNKPGERAFATGFGPGNYQLKIGELYGYDEIPNEEKMPPDSNNLYLVQAVSVGILGLSALLWVLLHFWAIAWRAAQGGSWLGAAVFGSLGAWMLVNPFHALVVRSAGLLLALFFALAVAADDNTQNAGASKAS